MAYSECTIASEECKYFNREPIPGANKENGCYSDKDHKVPQRLATTALSRAYIYSPDNLQQLCRQEHDEKCLEGDEPLPSREAMLESLRAQLKGGRLRLSRATMNRILDGTL